MESEMVSMIRACAEAFEREMAWNPTSHHGFEGSSTHQGGLLYGNFAQGNQGLYAERSQPWDMEYDHQATYASPISMEEENEYFCAQGNQGVYGTQSEYGESYQSWNMEYAQGETYPSPSSNEEETINLLKLLLEGQERLNESISKIDFKISTPTSSSNAVDTSHEELTTTKSTIWNEVEEAVEPTPIADFEEIATIQEEFNQEAEWIETKFLLGYMVDENLVMRGEDQLETVAPMSFSPKSNDERVGMVGSTIEDHCEGGLVVECKEDESEVSTVEYEISTKEATLMQPIFKKETTESHIEEASKEGEVPKSPMAQPFAKHLDLISTKAESIATPWKLPFEQVRMKEFRGWFYDEYDPGDTSLQSQARDFKQAHLGGNPIVILVYILAF